MYEFLWKNGKPRLPLKLLGVGALALALAATNKSSSKSHEAYSASPSASAACSDTLAELLATPESTHRRKIRLPNGVVVRHSLGGGFWDVHILLDDCEAQAYDTNPDYTHSSPFIIIGTDNGTHYRVYNQMGAPLTSELNPTASQMHETLHGQ